MATIRLVGLSLTGTLIAFIAIECLALPAKNPGRSVAALEANQAVRIVFNSQGCFQHQSYTLNLTGDALDKVLITEPDRKARVAITGKERQELDRTLEFYRSKPGGKCTTTDTITVYWMKYGIPVSRESFEDSTCSQDFLRKLIGKAVPGPSIESR